MYTNGGVCIVTEEQNYGAAGNLWERIRLINEWYPLAAYSQQFLQTDDVHQRSLVIADCCEWLSEKTGTTFDNELSAHLSAVLRSKEGEAFLRWAVDKVMNK
jgi:hypothetical protein